MTRTGIVNGRFQVLHLKHMEYILAAKMRCDKLYIGITNPDGAHTRDTVNDEKCLDLVKSCAEKLGKQVVVMSDPFYASEDFGYYLKKCPGAMIYLGNGEDYAALHTTEYDFNDHLLEAGVDLDLEIIREASKAPSVR